MKITKQGKMKNFCMPNAILTFKEYLIDYASEETRKIGEKLIEEHLKNIPENVRENLEKHLKETADGKRDLRF
jgi:2-iminoacetate synthase